MPYSVQCACGKSLAVSAADAGSTIPCSCGRVVPIPSLGKLARDAGEARTLLSPAERIYIRLCSGNLPAGTTCARCQFPTDGVLKCSVECERTFGENREAWKMALLFVVSPLWALFFSSHRGSDPEVRGRELVVQSPLRMCSDCSALFEGGRRSSELRKLLASVPEYDALLQQYPRAAILALRHEP